MTATGMRTLIMKTSSEGDLDAASIDDEIANGETRSTDIGAGPSVTVSIDSGDKKKLNKREKKRLSMTYARPRMISFWLTS